MERSQRGGLRSGQRRSIAVLPSILSVLLVAGGSAIATSDAITGDDAGRERVLAWADSLRFDRLEARFTASLESDEHPPQQLDGRWCARLLPLFAERLEYRRLSNGQLLKEERLSWDVELGEGRVFQLTAGSLHGDGTRTIVRPKGLSRVELPCDMFFLFRHDRPLGRWLRTMQVEVEALDASGERLVAFVRRSDESVVSAYVLDFSREQPIVELRAYIPPPSSPIEQQRSLDGGAIQPPAAIANHVLFVRKIVTESARIGSVHMPIRWDVLHSLRGEKETVSVSLVPESIRFDGDEPDGGYRVAWPRGTQVYDYGSGESYWIGENEERLTSEVIQEAELDAIVSQVEPETSGAGSASRETSVPTSCAANAIYVALSLTGRARPLEAINEELGVTPENSMSTVADILRVLGQSGVEALAVQGGGDLLSDPECGPAILHAIRRRQVPGGGHEELGHFLVVDDFDPQSETVRVFDPPSLSYRATLDQVEEAWTGKAILLTPGAIDAVTREIRLRRTLGVSAVIFGLGAIVALVIWRYRKSCKHSVSAPC